MSGRHVVVGAGIMGASIGHHLARAGRDVLILDAGRPARGTTGTSFARLSAFDKHPRAYFRLNAEGIAEHAALAAALPGADWFHPCGTVLLPEGEDDLTYRAARFAEWGYDVRWRDGTEMERELGARLPERVLQAPGEGWVDPVRLTHRLLEEARRNGAVVHTDTQVSDVARNGDGWHLTLDGKERLRADALVNAAGRGASGIAEKAGSALTLTDSPGLLVTVAAPGVRLRSILHTPLLTVRPDGPDRVLARSDPIDRRLARADDPAPPGLVGDLARDLLAHVRDLLPHLTDTAILRHRVGHRVLPAGGHPRVGGLAGRPGYYEAVSHSGVILAPLIGRLLAQEITSGLVPPALEHYRPALS